MLEASIYSSFPRLILGDSAHRCRRCGSGPVMGSDGFLMDHCMSCGNWQTATESFGPLFGDAKRKIVKWCSSVRARLLSKRVAKQRAEMPAADAAPAG